MIDNKTLSSGRPCLPPEIIDMIIEKLSKIYYELPLEEFLRRTIELATVSHHVQQCVAVCLVKLIRFAGSDIDSAHSHYSGHTRCIVKDADVKRATWIQRYQKQEAVTAVSSYPCVVNARVKLRTVWLGICVIQRSRRTFKRLRDTLAEEEEDDTKRCDLKTRKPASELQRVE